MKPSRSTSLPQAALTQASPVVLVKKISRRAIRVAPEIAVRGSAALLASFALFGFNPQALATSENWLGTGPDAVWTDTADWSNGIAPGATTGNNTDIATFNTALAGGTIGGITDPILNDNDRTLGGITFDTANAGAFVIGVNGGNLLEVGNVGGGTSAIQITATVVNPEVIAAPLQIKGYTSSVNTPYFFTNNATSTAATLSFTGLITANISTSRPSLLTLNGSNTGNNLISGILSNPSNGQAVAVLTKSGVGTWILSGSNTFSGSAVTFATTTAGIQVNQGTLVLENNAALGTTAASINNYINNGGTLQLNSSGPNGIITLGSNLTLHLQNGGTLSNSGTDTVASITTVSNAAGVTGTLATVNAGDVFTIGQVANGFTGGASDTVVHIAGPGTVLLNDASNYAGNWSIDSGTLELGNVTALGTLESVTSISSGGTLELNGLSPTLSALAGSGGTVENGSSSTAATLNFSNTGGTSTFMGSVVNGGVASLAVTKAGAGTLVLAGNNTYSGGTTLTAGGLNFSGNNNFGAGGVTVNAGTLTFSGSNTYTGATSINSGKLILNTSSAQLGETAITVANGATLAADPGAGNVQIGASAATVKLNPGALLDLTNGSTSVGTLTLEAPGAGVGTVLNLQGTSSNPDNLTFGVGSTGTADELIVNNGVVGVAASSPQTDINLAAFGSSTPTTLTGIPLLLDPNGTLSLADFTLETQIISTFGGGDYSASLSLNGSHNELLLSLASAVVSVNYFWTGNTSSTWSVPGNFATDTTGTTAQTLAPNNSTNIFETATAAHAGTFTQTLNGTFTVNSLTFTGATGNPITISGGAGTNFLTINGANGFTDTNTSNSYAAGTGLVVEAGSVANTISANLKLGSSQIWEIDNPSSAPLTVSGVIADGSNSSSLTKIGIGTLILTASNTYSGGTIVNAGTVMLGTGGNLAGAGSLTVAGSGATFDLGGNNQTVGSLSDGGVSTGVITSSTGSATLTVNNISADSYSGTITDNNAVNGAELGLTMAGSSTLTLSGSNSYTGLTTVTAGTLISATNAALGSSTSPSGGLLLNPSISATVDFTSGVPSIASLASSGAGTSGIVLGNGTNSTPTTLTVGGGGLTTVYNGTISDLSALHAGAIGSLVVSGGSLTLGGADTYTGTTVISGGTLIVNNTLALQDSLLNYNGQGGALSFGTVTAATFGGIEGAQNLALVNGSSGVVALTIGNGSGTTYSGALSGGGSLIVNAGTETFSGANDYTGTTAFVAGTQTVTGSIGTSVTPSGAVSLTGDTLDVAGGSIYAASLTNNTNNSNASVINVTANGIINVSGAISIGTDDSTINGLLSIVSGTVTGASLSIGRDGTNDGATAPVAGGTADGVYVNGGTLNIGVGANGVLSVGTAGSDNSTANMRVDSGSVTVGGITDITNNAGGRYSVLDINGGTFTDQDTSGIGINIGATADTNLDAELLVRGTGVLNTPAITLGNAADTGGTDEFQAIGGTVNIGAGGIVEIPGSTASPAFVVALGSATGVPIITATASWSSAVAMTLTNSSAAAAPTFQTASGDNITLSGTLSGTGGLTATGSGVLTLDSAGNQYSGLTTVNGGTLNINSEYALGGANYSGITISGGTLQYATTLLNAVTDLTIQAFTIGAGGATIDTNGNNVNYANAFSASSTGGLNVIDSVGGGSLTLSGSNTYTASTTVGSKGDLILGSTGYLGNTAITVNAGGTFGVKPNSGNLEIGTTGASLTLAAGGSFTMADGTIGTLTINGSSSGTPLNLAGTTTAPSNLTFDLGTTGADQLIVASGGISFAAANAQDDIFLDALSGAAPTSLSNIPILDVPNGTLLNDFTLESPVVSYNGTVYSASLSLGDSNTELLVTLVQGTPATYYFTGAHSASWSNINNFSSDPAGAFPQSSGSLGKLSDVYVTANNPTAGNFATEALNGNYTINSLSFTGTGTAAAATSITLTSGTTPSALTLDAVNSFSDAAGNSYGPGVGLVVQPGSAAHSIAVNINLGASQTWEINNSASNPLTVSGVIADAPSTTHDALTITGSGTLILTNANTYDGGTTVSGGTLMLGTGGALSTTGVLTVNGGKFDLGGNSQAVSGLSDGGVSTGVLTSSVGAGTLTVNNSAAESFSGIITDNNGVNGSSLALYLAGPGNFALSGSNSFTGGTTLGAGNLVVSNNYGLGAPASQSVNAGLTFNNTATSTVSFTSANPQVASINNDVSQTGAGNVVLGNTSNGGSATTLFLGAGGAAQTENGDTFGGIISDLSASNAAAVGSLEIVSGGFVTLTGANTFTGTTIISGSGAFGVSLLELGNSSALENSTLNYNNQGGQISFGNLTSVTLAGLSGSQNLALGTTNAVALTIGNNNVSSVYTGNLSGSGSVLKIGSGQVQFGSGANGGAQYTGSTVVRSGTLVIGGNSDLTGSVDLTGNPTTTGGTGAANGMIVQDNAIINSSSEFFMASDDGSPGGVTFTGPSTLLITGTASITVPSFSNGNASRVATGGFITINDNASLIVNGTFTLLNTIGSTASTTTINLNGGELLADGFNLFQSTNPGGQLVNFLFNGGVLTAGASDNPPTTTFLPLLSGLTASVMGGGAIINTNGFNITIGQPLVSGTTTDGGLTKLGNGILTLGTANSYNGPTNIEAGELAVTPLSIQNTSEITFTGSGGALQYSGTNTKDYSAKILNSTASIAIDTNGHSVTFASPLSSTNTGGLRVENATANIGGLTLTAANAYSGPTVVQSGADLILGAGGATPAGSTVTVSGSFQALAGNGGVGGALSLGSGSTLSMVDGSIGTLSVGGGMTIGGASAANIDLELDTNAGTNDAITVTNGALLFGAAGGVINVSEIAGDGTNPINGSNSAYPLLTDGSGLGTDAFTLGQSSIVIDGQTYLLSLGKVGTTEVLSLAAATVNYYFTGASSSSWKTIGNFATTISGSTAQVGTLGVASNIFLTATSSALHAGNFATETLDGNYTVNSLNFTGAGTGAASGIVLSSGTATAPLTLAAQSQYADANGNTYNIGTGLVVQPGSGANTINSGIALGNSQTWYINNSSSNPLVVNGAIVDGTGSTPDALTKSGSGTLIVNNAATYNGGTTINNGTLMLGSAGSLSSLSALTVTGTGTFDLAGHTQIISSLGDGGVSTGVITSSTGAATLIINNATPSTYSGAITDLNGTNGSLITLALNGSSNVTLSGSSTYSGGTFLNDGNLTVASNYGLGNPTSTNPSAGLQINPALSSTTEAFFTSNNPQISALDSGTNGTAIVSLGNTGASTATTLNIGASGLTSVFNGNIVNAGTTAIGNLAVAGGSVTLNGSDSFTGTTVVNAGTLVLGNTNALTNSIVNYNNQGGTLSFGALGGATIGGLEGAENLTLANASTAAITLTIQNLSNTANYSGALSGSGSLIVSGSNGTQIFSGVNGFSGTTTFSAITTSTSTIAAGGAFGTPGSPSGGVFQNVGSVLNVSGSIYAASIASNSGSIMNVSSGAIVTSTSTLGVNANNMSTAPGLLYITGGTVNTNSLTVGRDGLNNGGGPLLLVGGTSDGIYMTGGTLNVATTLGVGTPTNANSSVNFRMDGGTVIVGGVATITDHSGSRLSVMDINGGTFTDQDTSGVGVQIGGNGDTNGLLIAELLVRNTGVLNTPEITMNAGAQVSGTDAFIALGGTTNIGSGGIVSGTGLGTSLVELGSGSVNTAPVIAASASWTSSVPMIVTTSAALTAPSFMTTSGSNITLTGGLSGTGGINAKGTGVLTLGGVNTYTGATSVSGGRLIVSGSLTGTTSVAVGTSANLEVDGSLGTTGTAVNISGRLSGIGTINGATMLTSGTLASGFSTGSTTPGTLTSAGNIAFNSTIGTLSIRLGLTTGASGDNDQLSITSGALTLNDTTLRLSLGAAEATAPFDALYDIVSGGASGTGSGTDVFGNALASGDSITVGTQVFDVFYAVAPGSTTIPGNDIAVELVSVPEPGTWAEIIAGLGVLCIWQRSRRRDRPNA